MTRTSRLAFVKTARVRPGSSKGFVLCPNSGTRVVWTPGSLGNSALGVGITGALQGGMRLRQALLFVCALLAAPASPRAAADTGADAAALRLRLVTDAGDIDGTCVLIHREDRGDDAILYLLTSAHLFRDPQGGPPPRVQVVRVLLGGEHTLDVGRDNLFVAPGVIDVAILRATTGHSALVPQPLLYEAPSPGEVFLISGYGQDGAHAAVAERVRFRSTLLVGGDHDASALVGCVGAPAISRHGAFGVVSECKAGRVPIIDLFSVARSFIERHVPPSRPSDTAQARTVK
jgi:hypothetical protein